MMLEYANLPPKHRLPGAIWAAAAKICFEREGRYASS